MMLKSGIREITRNLADTVDVVFHEFAARGKGRGRAKDILGFRIVHEASEDLLNAIITACDL